MDGRRQRRRRQRRVFSGNAAGQFGGGLDVSASNASLNYLVLLNNSAGAAGGGLVFDGVASTASTAVGPLVAAGSAAGGAGGGAIASLAAIGAVSACQRAGAAGATAAGYAAWLLSGAQQAAAAGGAKVTFAPSSHPVRGVRLSSSSRLLPSCKRVPTFTLRLGEELRAQLVPHAARKSPEETIGELGHCRRL